MPIIAKEKREQLIREGYCTFENVLEPEMVAKLNAMSEWTIAQEDPAHFDQHRSQGCLIPYWRYPHPAFAELIVCPRAMAVLAELGFDHPKVWSGFVISKPPHAPPLFWHQDGVLWDHPISYTDQPQQYFLDVLPRGHEPPQRVSARRSRLSPETPRAARCAPER